jgi:hypothetical protein
MRETANADDIQFNEESLAAVNEDKKKIQEKPVACYGDAMYGKCTKENCKKDHSIGNNTQESPATKFNSSKSINQQTLRAAWIQQSKMIPVPIPNPKKHTLMQNVLSTITQQRPMHIHAVIQFNDWNTCTMLARQWRLSWKFYF